MTMRSALVAALLSVAVLPAAAKPRSDAALLRQQAEHVCYADVQKLCGEAIPDEDKIKGCMESRHSELSPACAKIYDQGIGG